MQNFLTSLNLTEKQIRATGGAFAFRLHHNGENPPGIISQSTLIHNPYEGFNFETFSTHKEIDERYGNGFYKRWVQEVFQAPIALRVKAHHDLELVLHQYTEVYDVTTYHHVWEAANLIQQAYSSGGLRLIPSHDHTNYNGQIWFH